MTVSSPEPSPDRSGGGGGGPGALPGPSDRARPNILVTGTPGTGKTTTASLIAEEAGMTHVDVSALVKKEVRPFFSLLDCGGRFFFRSHSLPHTHLLPPSHYTAAGMMPWTHSSSTKTR
jgi:hypothetical protein